MSQNKIKNVLLRSTILVGAAAFALPAFAQDQVAEAAPVDEEIVVTGTLIRNPNLEQSSPVSVIGAEEIELQQANVAEELLRELPGAVPSIGSAVNNGNGGASYVNLRGLGSNRNVVLLDGVRVTPSDLFGRFDLNNVPLALIERTDVLTGGASTTYGADAIGGVVNFITRKDFAGVEINASNQITEEGDGNRLRTDMTIGANFDDGRGNAVFSVGYQEVDPVYQGSRKIGFETVDSFTGTLTGSGTTVPSRFTVPGVGTRQINAAGELVPTFRTFNFNPYNIFQTPFERFNIFGQGRYEIAEFAEVYTRGLFSKNTVSTIVAPSGVFNSTVTVPVSNPFLPAAARTTFCANNDFDPVTPGIQTLTAAQCAAAATATSPTDPNYRTFTTNLFRRTTEVGPRISDYVTTIFDYQIGLRGDLSDSISYDLFGSYGESENEQTQQNYVLTSRIRQGLLATNPTTCLTDTNGCVPVNVFGPEGSITPNQIPFLTANATTKNVTSLAQVRYTVSGDFGVAVPFAEEPIGFAIGSEYRRYTARQESDLLSQTPGELGGAGGAAPNIRGAFDVRESFGELIAPIVQDKPFIESLTLEAGVRRSIYEVDAPNNPSFKTWTYKVGGSWEPGFGLKVRGNYARAVRAPNINELFAPTETELTNLSTDPCASVDENGVRFRPAPTGTLAAVCLAQGAPPTSLAVIAPPTAGQANLTTGGNLNIKPEKADTYTVGFVFQPEFVPGLSLTVDYWKIKVKGAVSTPTPGDIIAACFGADLFNPPAGAATSPACTAIGRNPQTGGLDGDPATTPGLPGVLSNLGTLDNEGVDLTINYRRDLGFADLTLGFVGTYNKDSKFQATPTALNRECVGYYSVNCLSPQPKFQFSQRTTLGLADNVDVSLLWRYIHGLNQEPDDIENGNGPAFQGTVPGFGDRVFNFQEIDAAHYFDLSTRVGVSDAVTFTFTVENLFDKKPPLVGNSIGSTTYNSGNTYPSTYDALGRRFGVAAKVRF